MKRARATHRVAGTQLTALGDPLGRPVLEEEVLFWRVGYPVRFTEEFELSRLGEECTRRPELRVAVNPLVHDFVEMQVDFRVVLP